MLHLFSKRFQQVFSSTQNTILIAKKLFTAILFVLTGVYSTTGFGGSLVLAQGELVVGSEGFAVATLNVNAPFVSDEYKLTEKHSYGTGASGFIKINGTAVATWNAEDPGAFGLPVSIEHENIIKIFASGIPGAKVTYKLSFDDYTDPTIEAVINPVANSSGWHNSKVIVNFICEDPSGLFPGSSGIESCPSSATVDQDGENQLVSGTAVDYVGNTATTEVSINIDKTPPEVNTSISTSPNSFGWYKEPVTISYQCEDTLSGVAECPVTQTISGEGVDQVITNTVEDIAGNRTQVQTVLNLDLTAPEISFISPRNQALLKESQPELQLLLSDNLGLKHDSLSVIVDGSPITSCEVQENIVSCTLSAPITNDRDVLITARIDDHAGNQTTNSISVAIDSDGDNVADFADLCMETAPAQTANTNGCSLEQLDSDSDGVSDAEEITAGSDPENSNSFPPVAIETFLASLSTIDSAGQRVELSWKVKGASTVSIRNDIQEDIETDLAAEGTLAINPKITTRYTLVATGPGGENSQELTITLDLPPPPPMWTEPDVPVHDKIATSLSVADDGSAYIGAFDGNFYKVNSSGQLEWALENVGIVMGKAALISDVVIIGANLTGDVQGGVVGRVYAIKKNKEELWSMDTPAPVVAAPTISEDGSTVFVITYSGDIYSINAQTGETYWTYKLPGENTIITAPALANNNLIINTESKRVFALDTDHAISGNRILWERQLTQ